jgi:hypothetical protein
VSITDWCRERWGAHALSCEYQERSKITKSLRHPLWKFSKPRFLAPDCVIIRQLSRIGGLLHASASAPLDSNTVLPWSRYRDWSVQDLLAALHGPTHVKQHYRSTSEDPRNHELETLLLSMPLLDFILIQAVDRSGFDPSSRFVGSSTA